MNTTTIPSYPRTSGLRFSKVDGLVLVIAAAPTAWMHRTGNPLWWMVAVVVGHFLLFCNVFRIRRSLELAWAVYFVVNVGWFLEPSSEGWQLALAYQLPMTALVIIIEMLTPSYHGVGAHIINRRLPEYLKSSR